MLYGVERARLGSRRFRETIQAVGETVLLKTFLSRVLWKADSHPNQEEKKDNKIHMIINYDKSEIIPMSLIS